MFPPTSTTFTSNGLPLTIHLFSTGKGKDKTRFRESRFNLGNPIIRRLNLGDPFTRLLSIADAILDPHFTDYLPIWVMAIEHPEGVFLIDTGINNSSFRSCGWLVNKYITTQFKFELDKHETIDQQLKALHITPTAIILTHLHFDHIDGLKYLDPTIPILINKEEWEHPFGNLKERYPDNFQPTLIDLDTQTYPKTKALTLTQDIELIHTPGHTYNHCSILIKTDTHHILFAGDVCYDQTQLQQNKFAANLANQKQAQQTYNAIKEYAKQHPLIFLPSHDPKSAERLTTRETLYT